MVVGTTLMKMNGDPYVSPQFNRRGLSAVFACQVLQVAGGTVDIDVEHKNAEDTSWTNLGSFASLSTVTTGLTTLSGIMEQVRFVYTVTGANAYSSIHILMLAPSWRPY